MSYAVTIGPLSVGLVHIADTNTGLTDLRLSSNKMAIEGSPWLGQILKYCPCLIHLDIAGNDVDEVSYVKACVQSPAHMHTVF